MPSYIDAQPARHVITDVAVNAPVALVVAIYRTRRHIAPVHFTPPPARSIFAVRQSPCGHYHATGRPNYIIAVPFAAYVPPCRLPPRRAHTARHCHWSVLPGRNIRVPGRTNIRRHAGRRLTPRSRRSSAVRRLAATPRRANVYRPPVTAVIDKLSFTALAAPTIAADTISHALAN